MHSSEGMDYLANVPTFLMLAGSNSGPEKGSQENRLTGRIPCYILPGKESMQLDEPRF
jgi:hypothetical protein